MQNRLIVVLLLIASALACAGCPQNGGSKNDATKKTATAPSDPASPAGQLNAQANPAGGPAANPADKPVKYTPPTPHGAADTPGQTDPKAGPVAPGTANKEDKPSAVGSVIGHDTNPINTGLVTTIVLETTKGDIAIDIHEKWAPHGYSLFLRLVGIGYYDGAPWYRVISGFAAQSGISPEPTVNAKYSLDKILDDSPLKSNFPGYVSFAQKGKNSRGSNFFINLTDNSATLDAKGYVPFGVVTSGMEVAQKLSPISDKALTAAGLSQETLAKAGGIDAFKKAFPQADYIKRAYILK